MAYTALQEMQKINRTRLGSSAGPMQPKFFNNGVGSDLKTAALRFIRKGCEQLRFGPESVADEVNRGTFKGCSIEPNMIPYNMQMDIDRICLEKALEKFIDSGTAEDAYEVYYCYLEMFIGAYGKSKSMVELLSEFEQNGSSLLMKHRDHYSHSVYVFALGLAIYETNAIYRGAFKKYYHFDTNERNKAACREANHTYLKFWGLTALFHDIGYPFELPFEQVMSYFEIDKNKRKPGILFLSYESLNGLTDLSEEEQKHFCQVYGKNFMSTSELFAYNIADKLAASYGFSEGYLLQQIQNKPLHPEDYNYFMDHAFFSSARLYRELLKTIGLSQLSPMYVDALSAILLHNSLFKFSIAFYKSKEPKKKSPLNMELHPLAYMLMLCDELQCWDRTAYGRNSRNQLFPFSADFDFSNNAIHAVYHYDAAEKSRIDRYQRQMDAFNAGQLEEKPRLKAYSEMTGKNDFVAEIKDIVDLSAIPFAVVPDLQPVNREKKHIYLSSSNFIHLYDFAVALSARRSMTGEEEELTLEKYYPKFDSLSLEYRLFHIQRAKSFSRYLNRIHCFYTDKPVDFDIVTELSEKQLNILGPMDHERWLQGHADYGWVFGNAYETCRLNPDDKEAEKAMRRILREQSRSHKLMVNGKITEAAALRHYRSLPESEQLKDTEPMNHMLRLIRLLDGVKVYKLSDDV